MKNKLIGLYELITGIFGVILLLVKIGDAFKSINIFATFLLGIILFGGTAYAGYALLNKLKNGSKYSIWSQALQTISFTYGGVQYLFTGSAFLEFIIKNGIDFQFKLTPIAFNISRVSPQLPLEIKLFIIPIILLLLLTMKK